MHYRINRYPYTHPMATLHPDLHTWRPTGAGQYAERAVLLQLRDGLPDGFDVFHSVDWSTVDARGQRFGEVDAVVVCPQGHLTLLEIKAGHLEEAPAATAGATLANTAYPPQLTKRYGSLRKDVVAQCSGQLRALRQRQCGANAASGLPDGAQILEQAQRAYARAGSSMAAVGASTRPAACLGRVFLPPQTGKLPRL